MKFIHACVVLTAFIWAGEATAQILKYDSKGRPISQDKYKSGKYGSGKSGSSKGSGSRTDKTIDKLFTHEPGEVLVVNPGANFVGKAITMGYRVQETIGAKELGLKILRLTIPRSKTPEKAIKELAKTFPGTTFDVNAHYHVQAGAAPKNARTARKMAGWTRTSNSCGKGLKIGVIDTGLDLYHPAFKDQLVSYLSFPKPGRKAGNQKHGTAVSSILAARADWGGLLPGARLYHANMFEINKKGKMVGTAAAFVKAMAWLVGADVHAVNISMAGKENKVIRRALDRAKDMDILVIASIGGWGKSDRIAYPAAYGDVVAVTALSGPNKIYSKANAGPHIDIAAPGAGVWAAKAKSDGGTTYYGTSYAAPFVTAVAAILRKAGRAPNPDTLRKILSKVVNDLGSPGRDDVFGFGALKGAPKC
ncbi:S8 family serine peptidase [Magnetovibrio sp. PR-2]|uniref:S8 family serine peptidase n=1 Tax=Magnetovibrio sp. PR-2 TaxID=3120356 RepID=UPI002FCDE5E7